MSNRRRILKVKNKFQDQMILEIILVSFIFINMLVMLSFFAMDTIRDLFRLKFTLAVALACGELGGLIIIYLYTLKTSHKIAGPVYMIERRLGEIAKGDLTVSLKLRKNDHFHDTADVLNTSVEQLRGKILKVRSAAEALRETLPSNNASRETLDGLFAALDEFKTERTSKSPAKATEDVIDEIEDTADAVSS